MTMEQLFIANWSSHINSRISYSTLGICFLHITVSPVVPQLHPVESSMVMRVRRFDNMTISITDAPLQDPKTTHNTVPHLYRSTPLVS